MAKTPDEFASDEQRDAYVAALVQEHGWHETRKAQGDQRYNEDDHTACAAELKRLGVDPKKAPAAKPADEELDGEFGNAEARDRYVDALKAEHQRYSDNGMTAEAAEVEAELARVTGTKKRKKTQAELDEEAAAKAEATLEELEINPGLVEHPDGYQHDGDKRAAELSDAEKAAEQAIEAELEADEKPKRRGKKPAAA